MIYYVRIILVAVFVITIMESCSQENKGNKIKEAQSEVVDDNESEEDIEEEFYEPDYGEMREEYILSYNDTLVIDTLFKESPDKTSVYLEFYCLNDNSVVLPKKYIWEESDAKEFVTHNFCFDLRITRNDSLCHMTNVNKTLFKDVLREQLIQYGVLKAPNLYYNRKTEEVCLQMSVSIPITDLGQGVYYVIDSTNHARIADNYEY